MLKAKNEKTGYTQSIDEINEMIEEEMKPFEKVTEEDLQKKPLKIPILNKEGNGFIGGEDLELSESDKIRVDIQEVVSSGVDEIGADDLLRDIAKKYKKSLAVIKKKYKDTFNFVKKNSEKKEEQEEFSFTSLIIDDINKIIVEEVKEGEFMRFCIYNDNTKTIEYKSELSNSPTIKPIMDEEVLKDAILLPSKAEDYVSNEQLDEDIKTFIRKWLDIPEDVLQFAVWNIKRSWVFERFHTLNYLRALGETGSGKSRFLDTLGYIHYKPIATSGATTSAPLFRIIDKWKGTLIMDEADFKDSSEAEDIIKIINQGYEKGKFIMRCDQNDASKINFFDPFCPKILGTRRTFEDKAVEGRCITQVMSGTNRKDIPLNLNDNFKQEALTLRNKLLMWRFHNYFKIDPNKKVDFDFGDMEIEPRMRQIISGIINLFEGDKKQMEFFKDFVKNKQEEIIEERRNSFAGDIVGSIYELVKEGKTNINASDIIEKGNLKNKTGHNITPRGISSTLKELGFGKTTVEKVNSSIGNEGEIKSISKRCIPLDVEHMYTIFNRFGYEVTVVSVVYGDLRKNLKEYFRGLHQMEGGLPYNRNLRNFVITVTDENVKKSEKMEEIEIKNEPTLPMETKPNFSQEVLTILGEKELSFADIYDAFKLKVPDMKPADFELLISNLKEIGEICQPTPDKYLKV